jgi:hypothetical protein
MTVTNEQLAKLHEPTPESEVKQRPAPGRSGKQLDYIDARYVMDTLDRVIGYADWQDEYRPDARSDDGMVCRIGILTENGWVWKEDVGTTSTIEGTKGAYSDAFKRAAVKWGIGRDLYDEDRAQRFSDGIAQSQSDNVAKQRRVGQEQAGTARPQPMDVSPDDAPWVCPEHEKVVAWPAGVSAAGRKYDAFYACPEGRDCPHRAPRGLKVKPEHLSPVGDDLPF